MQAAIERLKMYHAGEKIKVGAHYMAKPPEPLPPIEKPDPTVEGMRQAAQAFFDLSQIYKELGD